MELNSNRLKAFYQVAIDRNFHKAAENICISQSALSQRILKLEQEIKTTLLIRGSEGIKLSDAGTILFKYVQNLNSMEQETLNLIAGYSTGKSHGSLRIATYSSILQSAIMPALKPLIRRYPETHVEFFNRELRDLPGMLKSGEADFIVIDYFMEAVNLTKNQIGEEHLVHIQNNQQLNDDQVFLDHDADDMTTYNFFNLQNIKNLNIKRNYYDDIYGIINGVKLGYGQA
ncbi:MAG: LysR family transcriptional regulator, partial [Gammaproteobacteria bacterium]|nr:LysR family transcriptional regulator [Gammaproteobacteria bacterium]